MRELLKMEEFVFKKNYFKFGNKIKQQISGTTIETKFSLTYACDFILSYGIFFIWTNAEESLKRFLEELNDFNQYTKFIYEYSLENVTFLDLKVKLKGGNYVTDLHVKSTDRYKYLHFSSAYPNNTKRSIVFSQTLRISRLCSNESDFKNNNEKMRSWFVKREYPEQLIDPEIKKGKFNVRETNRRNKSKN